MVRSKASLYNGRMQSNADKAAPDLYTYMTRSSVSLTSLYFKANPKTPIIFIITDK
jgi:hypothetical protein